MKKRNSIAFCAMVLVGMCSCGSKDTPQPGPDPGLALPSPKLVKVEGIVTLDGKPLAGAQVMFVPDEGKDGRPASGFANAKGDFEMGTVNPDDGIVPGQYQVVVFYPASAKESKSRPAIPNKYTNPEETPLRCKVEKDGQFVKLDLKSK